MAVVLIVSHLVKRTTRTKLNITTGVCCHNIHIQLAFLFNFNSRFIFTATSTLNLVARLTYFPDLHADLTLGGCAVSLFFLAGRGYTNNISTDISHIFLHVDRHDHDNSVLFPCRWTIIYDSVSAIVFCVFLTVTYLFVKFK